MASSNPFDQFAPGNDKGGAAKAAPSPSPAPHEDTLHAAIRHGESILGLLDRPGAAVQAGLAGKDWKKVLLGGESGSDRNANRAALRHRIGLDDPHSLLGQTGTYEHAPHWAQGVIDTALDTVTDPTSLLGFAGAGRAIVGKTAERAMPSVLRAFEGARAASNPGSLRSRALNKVGDIGEHLSDITTPGGAPSSRVARALAVQTGSNKTYQQLYALRNVYDTVKGRFVQGGLTEPQAQRLALKWLGARIRRDYPQLMNGKAPMKDVVQFFTHAVKGNPQNDLIKASNLAKGTLFWNPLPHMRNIATLTALANPAALAGAALKGTKLAGADIAKESMNAGAGLLERFGKAQAGADLRHAGEKLAENTMRRQLGRAEMAGASHVKNFEQSQLINALQSLGPPGKALAHVYNVSGRALWGFDDAAKAALFEANMRRFRDPGVAAYHTLKTLVDYSHQSHLIRGMRYVAPFATWRARMPEAIATSLAENPQNALLAGRLTGGMIAGKDKDIGGGKKLALDTPFKQFLYLDPTGKNPQEALRSEAKYLRGSFGPSANVLAQLLADAADKGASRTNFFTYYNRPSRYLAHSIPGLGQALSLSGHGLFKNTPREEALYDLLGLQTIHQ